MKESPVYGDLIAIMLAVAVREPNGVDMIRNALEAVEETLHEELSKSQAVAYVH